MDREAIADLISGYRYGRWNLEHQSLVVYFNPEQKRALIPHFFSSEEFPTEGTCGELARTAARDVYLGNGGVHLTRVRGYGAGIFERYPKHHYLLASEQRLIKGAKTEDKDEIAEVLWQDPLLIDPSFGTVIPFSESDYGPAALTDGLVGVPYTDTLFIDNTTLTMILGISKNSVIGFYADLRDGFEIRIMVSPEGKIKKAYKPTEENFEALETEFQDLAGILRSIGNATVITTDKHLAPEYVGCLCSC